MTIGRGIFPAWATNLRFDRSPERIGLNLPDLRPKRTEAVKLSRFDPLCIPRPLLHVIRAVIAFVLLLKSQKELWYLAIDGNESIASPTRALTWIRHESVITHSRRQARAREKLFGGSRPSDCKPRLALGPASPRPSIGGVTSDRRYSAVAVNCIACFHSDLTSTFGEIVSGAGIKNGSRGINH